MDEELKHRRKIVRGWAKVMRSIAMRHPSFDSSLSFSRGENKFEESYRVDKTEVNFTNLDDFNIWACYDWDNKAGFGYARTVAPYHCDENYKNKDLATKLIVPILDCGSAFGFGRNEFITSCKEPVVTFRGETSPEEFDNYIRLVEMAETMIDGAIMNVENNRKRSFKYTIIKHPKFRGEATLKPLECKNNLRTALGISETSKEINLGKEQMMWCRTDELNRLENQLKDNYPRVVSVNDYLKGK